MNSFFKGFLSIFSWMMPKSLDESLEDLNDTMQELYEKNNWGKYEPGNNQILNRILAEYKPGPFIPYAFYNKEMDAIEVYFKNDMCYTKTLNNGIELHISHDTEEVVGVNILRVKKVLNHEFID